MTNENNLEDEITLLKFEHVLKNIVVIYVQLYSIYFTIIFHKTFDSNLNCYFQKMPHFL